MRDRTQMALIAVLLLAVALSVVFGVRGREQPPPLPTVDIGRVQTEAVQKFAVGLTSTVLAVPTSTATETRTPTTVVSEVASTGSVSPTPSCYRLKFLHDVTIPDYTIMTPAQVFTKTWQVQNTGTCPWRAGFKLMLIGGVAMGGSPYVLPATQNPGAQTEISIKMAAPTNQTGLAQGTWRMVDENGNRFGDALTVVIVIGGASQPAATAVPTGTP